MTSEKYKDSAAYVIVFSTDADGLMKKVNDMINEGYEPIGHAMYIPTLIHSWQQTMLRRDKEAD